MFGICGMWPVGVFLASSSYVLKSVHILVGAVKSLRPSCSCLCQVYLSNFSRHYRKLRKRRQILHKPDILQSLKCWVF